MKRPEITIYNFETWIIRNSIILSVLDLFWLNFFQNWTIQEKWTPQTLLIVEEFMNSFELHVVGKNSLKLEKLEVIEVGNIKLENS